MANKIKYGLKNVYYAVATIADDGSATYGEVKRLPGAVSLAMDPEGGQTNFYADNVVYWAGNANNGYSGSLELARIPETFLTDVLGQINDKKNVLIEDAEAPTVHFALLFQFEGDAKATRHVMYNCVAARPSNSGNTKEDTIEPQTETLDLTAMSVFNATLQKDVVKARTTEETDDTTYNGWFTAVYEYTAQ